MYHTWMVWDCHQTAVGWCFGGKPKSQNHHTRVVYKWEKLSWHIGNHHAVDTVIPMHACMHTDTLVTSAHSLCIYLHCIIYIYRLYTCLNLRSIFSHTYESYETYAYNSYIKNTYVNIPNRWYVYIHTYLYIYKATYNTKRYRVYSIPILLHKLQKKKWFPWARNPKHRRPFFWAPRFLQWRYLRVYLHHQKWLVNPVTPLNRFCILKNIWKTQLKMALQYELLHFPAKPISSSHLFSVHFSVASECENPNVLMPFTQIIWTLCAPN